MKTNGSLIGGQFKGVLANLRGFRCLSVVSYFDRYLMQCTLCTTGTERQVFRVSGTRTLEQGSQLCLFVCLQQDRLKPTFMLLLFELAHFSDCYFRAIDR
jgi:hypothetical protein